MSDQGLKESEMTKEQLDHIARTRREASTMYSYRPATAAEQMVIEPSKSVKKEKADDR